MTYALEQCQQQEILIKNVPFIRFTGNCVVTGKLHSVTVMAVTVQMWKEGRFLQDALPIPRDDSEFLISGITKEGWKKRFG